MFTPFLLPLGVSQVVLVVKNPPTSAGDMREVGLIPGLERPPGGGLGNLLQYPCLENLMDRGAWRAIVWGGSQRVRHQWRDLACMNYCLFPIGEMLIELCYFVTLLLSLLLTIKVSTPTFYRKLGPAGLIVKNKGEHLQEDWRSWASTTVLTWVYWVSIYRCPGNFAKTSLLRYIYHVNVSQTRRKAVLIHQEENIEHGIEADWFSVGLTWWLRCSDAACNAGDLGSIPGLGRSPGGGHGNPLYYSCLGNPHGQRSLASYSPWGCKELDRTDRLSTAHVICE